MKDHTCHAVGCDTPVHPKYFMCMHHWHMVPPDIQKALWAAYVSGQEVRKDPSDAWFVEARRAKQAVMDAELFKYQVSKL